MATTKTTTKKAPTKKAAPRATKAAAPKAETPKAALGELAVYSMAGKEVGKVSLPPELFAAPWKADLVHQVVTAMQANLRQNRAHTKDRSEVSGGGKKPWKQKGTGQARHGSTRSPIWRHGGITFGPRSERDYSEKINKRMRHAALVSALSRKAKDGELILVDQLSFAAPKTKEAQGALLALAKAAGANKLSSKRKNAALIAFSAYQGAAVKSFRNLPNVATEETRNLNPLAVLSNTYLVIEKPEEAFKALIARGNK
ncbi:MAG TPA: 50S ribosomal protein L4 [Candidatus Paceibacterota bacterium]|nr:50S ribosomal protein L4 [Candidatus Paceibacterota bacterium]